MAIFHLSAQIIGRTAGRSSVAAAAYRHGERLVDERTGLVHDYSRKAGVSEVVVLAPDNAPGWVHTPELWQRVEASETRKNSQTAREINIALPVELNPEQRRGLMLGYCREQFVRRGMVADVSFHDDSPENPHAHIMLTTRSIGPDGFGPKVREWNGPAVLSEWREQWQEHANRALESAGLEVRIDHRSLEAQQADALERGEELEAMKLNRGAQVHEGPKPSERVQVEQRTVAQELAEAQAKAALWEQANPEVVAAMRARADQERVRREEAEKDRAWSSLAASAVADTKSRAEALGKWVAVLDGERAEAVARETMARSDASSAHARRMLAEPNYDRAKQERRAWEKAHPWRMRLDEWGLKSSRRAELIETHDKARAELKAASAEKKQTYAAHDEQAKAMREAMRKVEQAAKQAETARKAYERARERLADIEAGRLTRQHEEATQRAWEQSKEQASAERRRALERRPQGPAAPMPHLRDEVPSTPRPRVVPRLRPPGHDGGRGMGR